jgi:hypothetical protein
MFFIFDRYKTARLNIERMLPHLHDPDHNNLHSKEIN